VTIQRACVFAYCALGEIATLDSSKRCAEYDITANNYKGPYRWIRTRPHTHAAATQPARSPASDCCVPVIRRSARRSSQRRHAAGSVRRRTSPRVNVNAREMLSLSLFPSLSLSLSLSLSVCTLYVQTYKPTYKRIYKCTFHLERLRAPFLCAR